MTLLKVTGISKQGEGDFVLKDINFSQKKYQKIAVAGETGSGKSTLLKIIAGLIQPDTGEVLFEGEKVKGPSENLVPGHPAIAYLSQDFELPKFLRVEQALEYSNTLSDNEASTLFKVCQIDHLLKRKTNQLSGGERQRIAIARLLIASPKLLLLDEPFTHLDIVHKNTLKEVIRDIGKRLKITCVLVSHDPEDTLSWADKVLIMKDGRMIQKGTPEQVYRQPVDEYAAGLFGKFNVIAPEKAKALCKLFKLKSENKILIRPENFRVKPKGKKAAKGKVVDINFFGSFYEVDVLLLRSVITVRTPDNNLHVGDRVFVSLVN